MYRGDSEKLVNREEKDEHPKNLASVAKKCLREKVLGFAKQSGGDVRNQYPRGRGDLGESPSCLIEIIAIMNIIATSRS